MSTYGKYGKSSSSDEISCDDALAEIYMLLDKECGPERDADLRRHIEDCPPCLEEYGIDEQIKQLLARKCGGDHAPTELKNRLQASIRETVKQRRDASLTEKEVTAEMETETE